MLGGAIILMWHFSAKLFHDGLYEPPLKDIFHGKMCTNNLVLRLEMHGCGCAISNQSAYLRIYLCTLGDLADNSKKIEGGDATRQ